MSNPFQQAVAFSPSNNGESIGNLTLGRGRIDGQNVHVAMIENKLASGALGVAECDKLASLFTVAAATAAPVVMFIDSAGVRVSEGLPALGAFRRMYAAALKADAAGSRMACVLGAHCFGGASMLAALCGARYFANHTRLAMSGPSILAATAGLSALDAAFHAVAEVSIGTPGRLKLDSAHQVFNDRVALPASVALSARHQMLGARLAAAKLTPTGQTESVQRKDLTALYPGGYAINQTNGMVQGTAGDIAIVGSIDRQPLTAARAHALAACFWNMGDPAHTPVKTLHVLVDCEAHSSSLEDEKVMLSMYLADLAHALQALQRRGTRVETIVLGKLGGGTYVALAAASSAVHVIHGKEIQLLPGRAIAAILGDSTAAKPEFSDYVRAGVAERELKIGLPV